MNIEGNSDNFRVLAQVKFLDAHVCNANHKHFPELLKGERGFLTYFWMKMTDIKIYLKADNWTVKGQLTNFGQTILTDFKYYSLNIW